MNTKSSRRQRPSFLGFVPERVRDLLRKDRGDAAKKYVMRYVEKGNPRAMVAMADLAYDAGNERESLEWIAKVERLAKDGDPDAPIFLSSAYQRGLGRGSPEQRMRKSLKMLEVAAENQNVVCAHALMSNYLYGLNGAEVSKRKFEYWARKAADWGSNAAAQALAKLDRWPNVAPDD